MTSSTINDEPRRATEAERRFVSAASEYLIETALERVDNDLTLALWALAAALAQLSARSIGAQATVDVFKSVGDILDDGVTEATKRILN